VGIIGGGQRWPMAAGADGRQVTETETAD